jgi:uncharacterized protein (DUF1786 family)
MGVTTCPVLPRKLKGNPRKHGYPRDKQESATQTALKQTKVFCSEWSNVIFMGKILAIDIGAGTQDVLILDPSTKEHLKWVAKAPTRLLAEKLSSSKKDILITGDTMGGGPGSQAIKELARTRTIFMTPQAASTIHNNLDKVRGLGIKVITEQEARDNLPSGRFDHIITGDIFPKQLQTIMANMGIGFDFEYVLLAVQDHGVPPPNVSTLDFRHQFIKAALEKTPLPESILYPADKIPAYLTRMQSVTDRAKEIPAHQIFVMDTGMAAILGASLEPSCKGLSKTMVVDIATSHTLAATLMGREITGLFEYHTHNLTVERLEELMIKLAEGQLSHQGILAEGGHGAYIRKGIGFKNLEAIIVTGPKRHLAKGLSFKIIHGAPLGDNMMTGPVGLLEALNRKESLGLDLSP